MTIVELVPEQISELSLIICHKFLEKLLLKIRWQFLEVFTFSDSYEIMFVIIDYHRLCKVRIFKWSILTVSLNLTKRHQCIVDFCFKLIIDLVIAYLDFDSCHIVRQTCLTNREGQLPKQNEPGPCKPIILQIICWHRNWITVANLRHGEQEEIELMKVVQHHLLLEFHDDFIFSLREFKVFNICILVWDLTGFEMSIHFVDCNFVVEEFFYVKELTVHRDCHPSASQNVDYQNDLQENLNEIENAYENKGR